MIEKIKNLDKQICKFNTAQFLRAVLLLTPITLLFYNENGLTASDLFLFQGIFYLTSIILEVPIGCFSDYIPKKLVLILSYIIFLLVMILWLCFSGYFIILAGEILLAVSKVMMDNAQSGWLYDYLALKNRKQKMTKDYGYLNFYLALGTTMAAIFGTWLYVKYGSHSILITEILISVIGISLLISLKSGYKPILENYRYNITKKLHENVETIKLIITNKSIVHYVFYSGFLTAFSILFALSFQPLMQKALFPAALFGIAAFSNHGIRALASVVTGKLEKFFCIRKMVIPLFFMYIFAFGCIFIILNINNIPQIILLINIICLIIGFQLMFTIRHVSRLHNFAEPENRGTMISLNNMFSRMIAFVILFSSKIFIDKLGFSMFYTISFVVFIIIGFILMVNAYRVRERV